MKRKFIINVLGTYGSLAALMTQRVFSGEKTSLLNDPLFSDLTLDLSLCLHSVHAEINNFIKDIFYKV